LLVSCEVTPHHLFLNEADAKRLGPLGDMRPRLTRQSDVDALWAHINTTIDCVASDHAPHTLAEKQKSENPPPGVPGLESTLPLLLTAAAEGRLSYERLIALLAVNPRRIYGLPEQPETWVEIDPQESYIFPDHSLYTKCGWSPFSGISVKGRIRKVVLRGKEVVKDGIVHQFVH
jgi:carbamoyl-phosphate synthase/aspartate carbamoyltransferase/dihydroorotase